MNPIRLTGRAAIGLTRMIGRVTIFAGRGLARIGAHPSELARQMLHIGWLSLPVVGLTALFTGAALALQIHSGGERFQAGDVVPAIVAIGMARELGPVLGGLMVAARVASSIAAEIGTMRVTDFLLALPAIGSGKRDRVLHDLRIAPVKRLGGLGVRQVADQSQWQDQRLPQPRTR